MKAAITVAAIAVCVPALWLAFITFAGRIMVRKITAEEISAKKTRATP